jgi:hypothetical protein
MHHVSAHKKLLILFSLVIVFAMSATTTEAQGRYRGRRVSRVVVVPSFYGGYYANPFFYADPWYGYQWHGFPPPYRYYGFEPEASVRTEVSPREAEVYIDGYYAGIADDFDGTFQRLRVEPGEHEIEIYLNGYRPFRQKVYLTPDYTCRIRHALQPLAAGEQPEPRPQPAAPPTMQPGQPQTQPGPRPAPRGSPVPRGPMGRRVPAPPPPEDPAGAPPRGGQVNSDYGTLAIRVQPLDAEVSVDGEAWRGPGGGQERLVIELAEGSHTVEIRKAGFRTYVTQVEIRRGQTAQLNVSLRNE